MAQEKKSYARGKGSKRTVGKRQGTKAEKQASKVEGKGGCPQGYFRDTGKGGKKGKCVKYAVGAGGDFGEGRVYDD